MRNTLFFFSSTLFLLLILFLSSCSELPKKKGYSEGSVEYSIQYLEDEPSKFNASMRPNKMVVKFKDNNTINKIEGLSSAFSFAFIQNMQTQTTYTLIKLLNKKLFHQEPIRNDRYPFAYSDMPKFTIQKSDETAIILGLLCHKVVATYCDSIEMPFEIWYTTEIGVEKPNLNTPFHEIDGIMLKFSAIMFNQKIRIEATSIKSNRISDDEFIIPYDYEEVDQDTVEDVVALLK